MSIEFEWLSQDRLGLRIRQLLSEALARFSQRITPDIDSDALVAPLIMRLLDELVQERLGSDTFVHSVASEHPEAFVARSPRDLPPDHSRSPVLLERQNIREWLDYELWAWWYLGESTCNPGASAQDAAEHTPGREC